MTEFLTSSVDGPEIVLAVVRLARSFGVHPVFRDVSFAVQDGDVYGLLAPQGSGKTTLLHIVQGFLRPTHGQIVLFGGLEPAIVRHAIGYAPERERLHPLMRVGEYLDLLGALRGWHRSNVRVEIQRVFEMTRLAGYAQEFIVDLPAGARQRLALAQGMLGHPALLLVDDPFRTLDPVAVHETLDVLQAVAAEGTTILLSSTDVVKMESLCTRVGVLAHGRIVAEAETALIRQHGTRQVIRVDTVTGGLIAHLQPLGQAVSWTEQAILLHTHDQDLQRHVLRLLLDERVAIRALESQENALEQFYLDAVRGPLPAQTLPVAVVHAEPEDEPYVQ